MIEAYTVGITLALENGVSEGLAVIRRDLGTVNRAVEGSAVGLRHLKRLADHSPLGPRAAALGTESGKSQARSRKSGGAPNQSDVARSELMPSGFTRQLRTADGHGRDLLHVAAASRPSADAARSAGARATSIRTEGDTSPRSGRSLASIAGNETKLIKATIVQVPEAARLQYGQSQIAAVQPVPRSSRGGQSERQADQPLAAYVAKQTPSAPSGLVGDSKPRAYDPRQSTSAAIYQSRDVPQPMGSAGERTNPANNDQFGFLKSEMPSAVPPPTDTRGTSMQGDVYLDGTRLGRWVADYLSKAVDRPRSGTTGFDPRMTATWPGAPVGS